MRVLIFHGYLLRGTGSNVYNASLAQALARLGHEVHLVCQDREASDLVEGATGSVTIHNPDIGGLLPVFVHDTYEGFEVRTFAELSDAELGAYIEANVAAVRELVASLGGVDAALANHVVMGPVILARAGLRYALKVHGSDLSYTILPALERFRPYAEEAVAGANGILVGSGHIAARLRLVVDDPEVNAKVRLGPPGVDTHLFAPIPPSDRSPRLQALARTLRESDEQEASSADAARRVAREGGPPPQRGAGLPRQDPPPPTPAPPASAPPASSWDRDAAAAAEAVEWFGQTDGPRAIFVGKLIVSKGVDLLLAAWPLIHRRDPRARLLLVGFGALEATLRGVVQGFAEGDLGPLEELAARGRGLEDGDEGRLAMLSSLLDRLPDGYRDAARAAAESIAFSGRLEHDEVAAPVAASEALIFPSTFPEAFGMVAAEAAAAGVMPVSAAHSGAAEVSRALAEQLPESARELVSFELDDAAAEAIATRVNAWLALDEAERERAREALRSTVERLWSWEGVARAVLDASAGELAGLPVPVVDRDA